MKNVIVLEGKIVPGKEIDRMIGIITEINLKYGVLISVYPISEEGYSTINSPLLINVRREGMPGVISAFGEHFVKRNG